jgi:hypothetical protein
VSELQTLTRQRTQEKKAALRKGTRPTQSIEETPKPAEEPSPNEALDAETERVLKHLGVRAIGDLFARQFAGLTKEERLLWLNSFLFFMTADLRKLDDKIAKVRGYRSLGQARNFLLGGESGMGKTTYLDWLLFNHLPAVEEVRNHVPIIGIEAPVSQIPPDPCCGGCCWNAGEPTWHATTKKFCS